MTAEQSGAVGLDLEFLQEAALVMSLDGTVRSANLARAGSIVCASADEMRNSALSKASSREGGSTPAESWGVASACRATHGSGSERSTGEVAARRRVEVAFSLLVMACFGYAWYRDKVLPFFTALLP